MSLVRYHIQYQSLSMEQRTKLIERIDEIAYTGFAVYSDFCSGEFFLNSDDELKLIDFPDECILTKL